MTLATPTRYQRSCDDIFPITKPCCRQRGPRCGTPHHHHQRTMIRTPAPRAAFEKFSSLPCELRVKIFDAACYEARTVDLWYERTPSEDNEKGFVVVSNYCRPPSILHTSREARRAGLKCYRLSFAAEDDDRATTPSRKQTVSRGIWINWNSDIICFMSEEDSDSTYSIYTLRGEDDAGSGYPDHPESFERYFFRQLASKISDLLRPGEQARFALEPNVHLALKEILDFVPTAEIFVYSIPEVLNGSHRRPHRLRLAKRNIMTVDQSEDMVEKARSSWGENLTAMFYCLYNERLLVQFYEQVQKDIADDPEKYDFQAEPRRWKRPPVVKGAKMIVEYLRD